MRQLQQFRNLNVWSLPLFQAQSGHHKAILGIHNSLLNHIHRSRISHLQTSPIRCQTMPSRRCKRVTPYWGLQLHFISHTQVFSIRLAATQRVPSPVICSAGPMGSPWKKYSHEPSLPHLLRCSSTRIYCNYSVVPELEGRESQDASQTIPYCLTPFSSTQTLSLEDLAILVIRYEEEGTYNQPM